MKNKFIIIPLIVCLFSCGGTQSSSPAQIDDTDRQEFYNSEIVDFSKDGLSKFYVSDGYGNGTPFGNTWSNTCVEIENNELKMTIKEPGDIPCQLDPVISGAVHYRGDGDDYMMGYGYYSCVMKPVKGSGVVSAFFTYSNENNNHNEIDIEFLGKNTRRVQFNYYVDTEPDKGHEYMCDLPYDYTEDYHKYGFLWTSEKIVWYIDDEPVYKVEGNVPTAKQEIISNLWTIDSKSQGGKGWGGEFDRSTMPLSMYIKSMSFVPLEVTENNNYYHYDAVPATLTENGSKEHWVNKKTGEVTLIEPTGEFVKIEDQPAPTQEEINSWEEDDARIEPKYIFDGNKLRFGSYPQTQVNDNTLKSRLKHQAGGVAPSESNPGKWQLLDHYSGGRKSTKMFYQDVFDSVSKSKYRGIYLLENRPHDPVSNLLEASETSLLNQSTQYKNEYNTGRFYWFKFEPIVWDINTNNSTTYVLTSNLVLDAHEFDFNVNSTSATSSANKGENVYKDSTLRSFLNDEFKNTAFNESQLSFINDYSVDGEKDKVSVNSETNIITYYGSADLRNKSPSRYALAMGAYSSTNDIYGSCFYWAKSSTTTSYRAVAFNAEGKSINRDVWYTNTGVLPCISINVGGITNA